MKISNKEINKLQQKQRDIIILKTYGPEVLRELKRGRKDTEYIDKVLKKFKEKTGE